MKEFNPKYINFLECDTVIEANGVDMSRYTFLERLSAERGKYIFKIRERVRENGIMGVSKKDGKHNSNGMADD